MSKKLQNKGLGRGLGSLLPSSGEVAQKSIVEQASHSPLTSIKEIELKDILPNPYQPRTEFDNQKIEELAASIKAMGVIQPITVKKLSVGKYQIISGERRFRASTLAGIKTIPAYIKDVEEDSMLEMALVENIQREDLDAIDIAISFQRLIDECNLTQEELSERVGKKRATIANYLRLLKLDPQIQVAIKSGQITMGHAKAILGLENPAAQLKLTKDIIEAGLSVRESEALVQKLNGQNSQPSKLKGSSTKKELSPVGSQATALIGKFFKEAVKVKPLERGGQIIIRYNSDGELKEFLSTLQQASK